MRWYKTLVRCLNCVRLWYLAVGGLIIADVCFWFAWVALLGWAKVHACAESSVGLSPEECVELDRPRWNAPIEGLWSDPTGHAVTQIVYWLIGTCVAIAVLVFVVRYARRRHARESREYEPDGDDGRGDT